MTNFCFNKAYIYGLFCACHSEGVRYVGQSIYEPQKRLGDHIATTKYRQSRGMRLSHQQSWMLKHGFDNICFQILEVCFEGEANEREKWWIANTPNLTNIRPGGDQERGWKMPPEVVEARRGAGNAMYGKDRSELMDRIRKLRRPPTPERRNALAERLAEARLDSQREEKRIAGIRRSHNTPEYLEYASKRMMGENNPNYGKPWSDERRDKTQRARLAATGLTEDDIRQIRAMHKAGKTNRQIAAVYGRTENGISGITAKRKWAWVV